MTQGTTGRNPLENFMSKLRVSCACTLDVSQDFDIFL